MTDTVRLNYIDRKVYTRFHFDNATKTWWVGDSKNEKIFCKHSLRDALDVAFDYSTGHIAHWSDLMQSESCCENFKNDEKRVSFLNAAIFNHIYFDELTSQWIIGDKDSNIPVSINSNIRLAIDKLI
jgi:hypothetical protein